MKLEVVYLLNPKMIMEAMYLPLSKMKMESVYLPLLKMKMKVEYLPLPIMEALYPLPKTKMEAMYQPLQNKNMEEMYLMNLPRLLLKLKLNFKLFKKVNYTKEKKNPDLALLKQISMKINPVKMGINILISLRMFSKFCIRNLDL